MYTSIETQLKTLLETVGIAGDVVFSKPPKSDMGDYALPCFELSKKDGVNPAEYAKELAEKIQSAAHPLIQEAKAFGPYVNFFLHAQEVARLVLETIDDQCNTYGSHTIGNGQTYVFEFAHPNTHKAFHIGHLRNIITGESLSRIFENAGYTIHRVNYQGDVGMHIAKCLWAIQELHDEFVLVQKGTLDEKIAFLGKAYAYGSQSFEERPEVQEAVKQYNANIYTNREAVEPIYSETRAWSLSYFDRIYARVGTQFERFYFESEVFARGKELVEEYLTKGVFQKSDGAVIFPGSQYGLHDRVFLNSQGFPTYEGKEVGLAELQFSDYTADRIVHITGSEQSPYFSVVFKAIEHVFPHTANKEKHVTYGWVRLKEGKMSSRLGNVVLGEQLLGVVEELIGAHMAERDMPHKQEVIAAIASASIKYAFLKVQVDKDIAFDMEESVSTTGDSGPYVLYIIARMNTLLKNEQADTSSVSIPHQLHDEEKQLLLVLAAFPKVTNLAREEYNPSHIANYLYDIAKQCNRFYEHCPVLKEENSDLRAFRLQLLTHVRMVMNRGLGLLGISSVDEM